MSPVLTPCPLCAELLDLLGMDPFQIPSYRLFPTTTVASTGLSSHPHLRVYVVLWESSSALGGSVTG